MSFVSIQFLLFFPIVALAYFLFPIKSKYNLRNIWLLIASYFFYMSWNPKYALLILVSTITTYFCGIMMTRISKGDSSDIIKKKQKNICLLVSIILNLTILAVFKYGNFFIHNVSFVLSKLHISINEPHIDLLLPVGISFYTFQALGYTMDVYREDIEAEKDFIQYALFVSFFPQLVAGPIERSNNLLQQLKEEHKFNLLNIREGLLTMLWGFFMKIVIADRIAIFVDTVYNNYSTYYGWYLIVATILFGIQIYCDFNGYTMIARGAAKIMGFSLIENFDAPYLATSVKEFWKKWHISLTSWFTDYLYIPLGGNRKGKIRKYINIIIVFSVSGLWHGANWTFIFWGLLNGIYQVIEDVLKPVRDKIIDYFKLNRNSLGHKIISIFATFVLVDFSWMFFRSDSLHDSISIGKSMITAKNVWILFDFESLFQCGISRNSFGLLLFAILILFFSDILKAKKISVMRDIIFAQDLWFRWAIYIISFLFVLIYGIWGSGYENAAFLYFQF